MLGFNSTGLFSETPASTDPASTTHQSGTTSGSLEAAGKTNGVLCLFSDLYYLTLTTKKQHNSTFIFGKNLVFEIQQKSILTSVRFYIILDSTYSTKLP